MLTLAPFSFCLAKRMRANHTQAGSTTRVLRNASVPSSAVASAEAYEGVLSAAGITLGMAARSDAIWAQVQEMAAQVRIQELSCNITQWAHVLQEGRTRAWPFAREVLFHVKFRYIRPWPWWWEQCTTLCIRWPLIMFIILYVYCMCQRVQICAAL